MIGEHLTSSALARPMILFKVQRCPVYKGAREAWTGKGVENHHLPWLDN